MIFDSLTAPQEPFAYTDYYNQNQDKLRQKEWLWLSVEPVCRYYVELRYTLIQLLYDTMFENQINGLPIARPLVKPVSIISIQRQLTVRR
jgi:hypothetical protein